MFCGFTPDYYGMEVSVALSSKSAQSNINQYLSKLLGSASSLLEFSYLVSLTQCLSQAWYYYINILAFAKGIRNPAFFVNLQHCLSAPKGPSQASTPSGVALALLFSSTLSSPPVDLVLLAH